MQYEKQLQTFYIHQQEFELFVPLDNKQAPSQHSPYWAKVWPSAIGLCYFLSDHLHYIRNKQVLEIAAGIGLPSVFAAPYAQHVCASDIEPIAVSFIQDSFTHNKLSNTSSMVIDWKNVENISMPDVVLLSDINYEPDQFDTLFTTIQYFLNHKVTILLSTPQRLMAKPFIDRLLHWRKEQYEFMVDMNGVETAISVFVLNS
jgi:predicted nicotinamide N-methyase